MKVMRRKLSEGNPEIVKLKDNNGNEYNKLAQIARINKTALWATIYKPNRIDWKRYITG